MLNIFSHAYWPSVYLLCRNVYLSPLSVVKLSCLSFCCWVLGDFCVFLLNPYQIYDLQIFSPILWVVVLHLDNVLWFTKVLNFDKVRFMDFFSFVACSFGVLFKNLFPNPKSWRFTLMSSSKRFTVLAVIFESIYFELIFAYGPTLLFSMW